MKNIILILALTISILSCKTDKKASGYDTSETLDNIADNFIISGYTELATNATNLKESISTLKTTVNQTNLDAAQQAFITTYKSWQKISMFDFGPAVDEGLSSLNIFPTNTSKIESNILSGTYDLESGSIFDAIGFPALDYLLFNDTDANLLVKMGDANYINFIEDVALQIEAKAVSVNNNWKNSYKSTFVSSTKTDAGGSISILANAFILDFERGGREAKIGIPAGVRTLNEAIPTKVEAFYSKQSIALAKIQIETLKNLYGGQGGKSYKSILISLEKNDLANNISKQFTEIETSLNTLTDPFSDMLFADNQPAISTYAEYQKLLPLLKVDMTATLGLLITYSDNDGD